MRGHIKRLNGKRGTRWLVVLYNGKDPLTGKARQIWKRFDTKPEAERFAASTSAHLMGGGSIPANNKTTMKAFLEKWLEDYVGGSLAATSQVRYRSFVKIHLVPAFGHLALTKLSPDVIQAFLTKQLQEKKLSQTSIVLCFRILHKSMESALKWGMISRNPCDAVETPKRHSFEPTVMDTEQTQMFLAEAKRSARFYPLLLTAVLTGMRLGEIQGLRWSDISFLQQTISVNQTAVNLCAQGWQFEQPKTKKSRRNIPIPGVLVSVLREMKKEAMYDLVFASPLGNPIDAKVIRKDLAKVLKKVKLPAMRFHDLRHTSATLMLQQGTNPKIVQERLGHSTISMTLDTYSHVMPGMQEKATADLEKQLFGERTAVSNE